MTAARDGRPQAGPQAEAGQQKTLVAEFRTLLVHTYSGALSTYKNEVIEFQAAARRVQDRCPMSPVRTQVKRPGYRAGSAHRLQHGEDFRGWKVYYDTT